MEIADTLRSVKDGTEMEIIVSPNSNRKGIEGLDEWRKRVIIRVKSPPLDGKANKEVEDTLEEIFDTKCSIIRGQTSRQKTVLVSCPQDNIITVLERILKQ